MSQQKTASKYSVSEWYGVGIEKLAPGERIQLARTELEAKELTGKPCPFKKSSTCNKRFGFCSIRKYHQAESGGVVSFSGPVVTTCPRRFLEADRIFAWVGEELLGTAEPLVLNQIGFLNRLSSEDSEDTNDRQDLIGRIDNVLVHPSRDPLDWCALEIQAVYFSGRGMENELSMLAKDEETLPFPIENHRPDWRSSGPKRLLPQLETKVPTISTWGKKMAVVIDEGFFGSLIGLERERYLSNAEIVWFIVGYDPADKGWTLRPRELVYSRLIPAVKALTGGIALPREKFEEELRIKLGRDFPGNPLGIARPPRRKRR